MSDPQIDLAAYTLDRQEPLTEVKLRLALWDMDSQLVDMVVCQDTGEDIIMTLVAPERQWTREDIEGFVKRRVSYGVTVRFKWMTKAEVALLNATGGQL